MRELVLLCIAALLALTAAAAAQPRGAVETGAAAVRGTIISGSFANLREACRHVPEISASCAFAKRSAFAQAERFTVRKTPFTLFPPSNAVFAQLTDMVGGPAGAERVFGHAKVATKTFQATVVAGKALGACDVVRLAGGKVNGTVELPSTLQNWNISLVATSASPCSFLVGDAPVGRAFRVGSGLLYVVKKWVPVDPLIPEIFAQLAPATPASTSAAATGDVPCPSADEAARVQRARPDLDLCIAAAMSGCRAGWGASATFFCPAKDQDTRDAWAVWSASATSKQLSFEQLQASAVGHCYVPRRLALDDLPARSSFVAHAGNNVTIECERECAVRVAPGGAARVLVDEVSLGQGIVLMVPRLPLAKGRLL